MCMGSNKPSVYTRPDPALTFVDGNIKDPKDETGEGFENPEPSVVKDKTTDKPKVSLETDLTIPTY